MKTHIKKLCDEWYNKGRADKYQEIISEYMLLTEEQVADIRADVLDVVIKSLEAQFLMQNNPNSKFVETIVLRRDFIDELEQLKEQNK